MSFPSAGLPTLLTTQQWTPTSATNATSWILRCHFAVDVSRLRTVQKNAKGRTGSSIRRFVSLLLKTAMKVRSLTPSNSGLAHMFSVRVSEEEGNCIVCLEIRADELMRHLIPGELTNYRVVRTNPEPLHKRVYSRRESSVFLSSDNV
jgi:hypothetical protein